MNWKTVHKFKENIRINKQLAYNTSRVGYLYSLTVSVMFLSPVSIWKSESVKIIVSKCDFIKNCIHYKWMWIRSISEFVYF